MEELADLVSNRPLEGEERGKPKCPICKSRKAEVLDHYHTCLGGDPDPNHHWMYFRCKECGREFTMEFKYENVWYTIKGVLLAGVPNCFESYAYKCRFCEGVVSREYKDLGGLPLKGGLCTNLTKDGPVHEYRVFYRCEGCDRHIEVHPTKDRVVIE